MVPPLPAAGLSAIGLGLCPTLGWSGTSHSLSHLSTFVPPKATFTRHYGALLALTALGGIKIVFYGLPFSETLEFYFIFGLNGRQFIRCSHRWSLDLRSLTVFLAFSVFFTGFWGGKWTSSSMSRRSCSRT